MASRLYKVSTPKGVRLIDAGVKAQALAFVAKDEIVIEVASGHEIASLVASGVKVESINGPSNKDLFQDEKEESFV
jgi:hypothetical protein